MFPTTVYSKQMTITRGPSVSMYLSNCLVPPVLLCNGKTLVSTARHHSPSVLFTSSSPVLVAHRHTSGACLRSNKKRLTAICRANDDDGEQPTAVIRKVVEQYEREGKTEESQRLRKLFNLDTGPAPPTDPNQERWGILDWQQYNQKWEVPWGAGTTAAGLLLWAGSFVLTGIIIVPALGLALHLPGLRGGTAEEQALFALFNQILETAVGLGVVRLVVQRSLPLAPDMFVYDARKPLQKPRGWLSWALLGLLSSPAVVFIIALLASLLVEDVPGGRGTADAIAGIIDISPTSYVALLTVTSVLAPLLEETVFRGFLLTSLTKLMPTPAAVLLSSLLFGAAHLSPRDFPQLTALGIIMGFAYVRSRNLLTPMAIHGIWNGSVLTILFVLTASGIDVEELLAGREAVPQVVSAGQEAFIHVLALLHLLQQ